MPGFDFSGVVAKVGPGVTDFDVGDEVFAMLHLRCGGGYAEYATVKIGEAAGCESDRHMYAGDDVMVG